MNGSTLTEDDPQRLDTFGNQLNTHGLQFVGMPAQYAAQMAGEEERTFAELADGMAPALLFDQIDARRAVAPTRMPDRDAVAVFVLTRAPASFAMQAEGLGGEEAYVIYRFEVWKDD